MEHVGGIGEGCQAAKSDKKSVTSYLRSEARRWQDFGGGSRVCECHGCVGYVAPFLRLSGEKELDHYMREVMIQAAILFL